jgi:hypothetical protein
MAFAGRCYGSNLASYAKSAIMAAKICSDYHGGQRQAKPTDPSSRRSRRVITHSDKDPNSFESRSVSRVAFNSLTDGEKPSAQNSLQTKPLPTRRASTP